MATLNLGNYKVASKNSQIGYNKEKDAFAFASVASASKEGWGAGFVTAAAVTHSTGNIYSIDLSKFKTAISSVTDTTAGRDWNITLGSAVSSLTLGSGQDTVSVAAAHDAMKISTGAGNDSIVFGTADDTLTIDAGAGDDTISVGTANKDLKLELGAGKDSVLVSAVLGNLNINSSGSDAKNVLVSAVGKSTVVNINLGGGADTLKFAGSTAVSGKIALGAGKDSVVFMGGLNEATITSGAGDKNVSIASDVNKSSITLGAGNDLVNIESVTSSTVNLGDGNDSLTIANLDDASIYGGAGKDKVTINGAKSGLVDLGAGDDEITVTGDGTSVALGAGKDTISVTASSKVTLTDFAVTDDVIKVGSSDTVSVNADGVAVVGGASLQATSSTGYYALRFNNGDKTWIEGWGGENAAMLNASGATESVILHGVADVADTLVGGKKADTLYVERENYAVGGKGNDSLIISSSATDSQEHVGLTADGGKDTVSGFTTGAEGDVVYLYQDNLGTGKLTTDSSNNLVVKDGSASLTLEGNTVGTDLTVNVKDKSGAVKSVDYVATEATVTNTDDMADIYYAGSNTTSINFSNVDETLVVDLNNRNINFNNRSLANSSSTTYYGKFASVTGGSDTTILMGSATEKNTLMAGTGDTSIWGGGAKADLLDGNTSASDNVVTFYYQGGDGKDTIQNADWGGEDNNDVLYLNNFTGFEVKNDGSKTTVKLGDSDKLTIAGLSDANTVVKYTTDGTNVRGAKVGQAGQANTWTYAEGVDNYLGGTKNTLTVGNDVDGAQVWLDGAHGATYDSVAVVDASSNASTVGVAGSANNESLVGGTGETSLWGGAGNDTLQGSGVGTTTFYFGKGDGNDVITNSGSDDKVVLYNVALSDFAGIDTATSGQIKATLTDGSTLTIQNVSSSSVSTFKLADGSTWTYDASEGFKQA